MRANPQEVLSGYPGLTDHPHAESILGLERRKRVRAKVHWHVLLFRDGAGEAIESLTQDLSSTGFYCLSPTPFASGDCLICALEVPMHDPTGSECALALQCRVRIVRSESLADRELCGIACQIEDYGFQPLDSSATVRTITFERAGGLSQ